MTNSESVRESILAIDSLFKKQGLDPIAIDYSDAFAVYGNAVFRLDTGKPSLLYRCETITEAWSIHSALNTILANLRYNREIEEARLAEIAAVS